MPTGLPSPSNQRGTLCPGPRGNVLTRGAEVGAGRGLHALTQSGHRRPQLCLKGTTQASSGLGLGIWRHAHASSCILCGLLRHTRLQLLAWKLRYARLNSKCDCNLHILKGSTKNFKAILFVFAYSYTRTNSCTQHWLLHRIPQQAQKVS